MKEEDHKQEKEATVSLPLILQHEQTQFDAGLCLSNLCFSTLEKTRQAFLHPKELLQFNQLRHEKRQYSYLLGRYCAKQALTVYPPLLQRVNDNNSIDHPVNHATSCTTNGPDNDAANNTPNDPFRISGNNPVRETEIEIKVGVFHHPLVNYKNHNNLRIGITHTKAIGAAVAFPEALPMGIDIEEICTSNTTSINSQLTSSEQHLPFFGTREIALTRLWTLKEALSKALLCGLAIPFDLLEVDEMSQHGNTVISSFKNFKLYQATSFLVKDAVCTLVYPHKTSLIIDIPTLQKAFEVSNT